MNGQKLHDFLFSSITSRGWKRVGIKHHHGINIPLSSIHTEKSCGIGEFLDLLPIIDWCHLLKMDVLQLLPINESGKDPSPYNALSSCAIHPIYLSLWALPHLDAHPHLKDKLASFRPFNFTKRVHYHDVKKAKMEFLQEYIALTSQLLTSEEEYQKFLHGNHWLYSYSLFKVFKKRFNQTHWQHWPHEISAISGRKLGEYYDQYKEAMQFYFILQYLCYKQLLEVKTYAENKGVFLKGDIPILISPDSVDVWAHREFFDLSLSAGSPSTAFNPEGQYWGFPLYNWKAMRQNHFEWWKRRLQVAENYFHIFRVDHIIGFFRIWAIPRDQSPLNGFFTPSEENLMRAQGKELLELLCRSTTMLPIGEDLGVVPLFVSSCLEEFGISGTKILRWERRWDRDGSFIPISQYSPISMSSVSTHDLNTVALWWKQRPEEAKAFAAFKNWKYQEKISWDQQFAILWDCHHTNSLFHINLLQEYLALTPELTWSNYQNERINYPGTMQAKNWTYRYKEPLEVLTTHEGLMTIMQKILTPECYLFPTSGL